MAASSVLSYPEGRATLAAARRGGRLTATQHSTVITWDGQLRAAAASLGHATAPAR